MALLEYIQKLQKKTPSEKYKIAFGVSAGISVVICLIWLSLVHIELEDIAGNTPSDTKELTTPFEAITNNVSDTYDSMRNQANSFLSQEATSGLTE